MEVKNWDHMGKGAKQTLRECNIGSVLQGKFRNHQVTPQSCIVLTDEERLDIHALAPRLLAKTSLSKWSPSHFPLPYSHLGSRSLRASPSYRDPALGLGSKSTSWTHMPYSGNRDPSGNGSTDSLLQCCIAPAHLLTYRGHSIHHEKTSAPNNSTSFIC